MAGRVPDDIKTILRGIVKLLTRYEINVRGAGVLDAETRTGRGCLPPKAVLAVLDDGIGEAPKMDGGTHFFSPGNLKKTTP